MLGVRGSSPLGSTRCQFERRLRSLAVAGSSLIVASDCRLLVCRGSVGGYSIARCTSSTCVLTASPVLRRRCGRRWPAPRLVRPTPPDRAAPTHPMLFDPSSHEPMTERPWDDRRVRAAIATVVADAESAFDERLLWPAHPLDEDVGPLPTVASLYLGASGVVWALHQLERVGAAELQREWAPVAVSLVERYLAQPDFQDYVEGPVPSLWMGEAGILLVAHTLAPAAWQEERLLEAVRANAANPSWELMWGSPGTMIAAQVMYERTGAERWLEAWRESADRLWAEWRDDLWLQDLYGSRAHISGRRTASPATSSRSPGVTSSTQPAAQSWNSARSRQQPNTPVAPTVSASGRRCRPSHVRRRRFEPSGATAHRGSSPRSPRSLRTTSS